MVKDFINELKANRLPLHPRCSLTGTEGMPCSHACKDGSGCAAYYDPSAKWRIGDCVLADAALRTKTESKKVRERVGQQKQKKKH